MDCWRGLVGQNVDGYRVAALTMMMIMPIMVVMVTVMTVLMATYWRDDGGIWTQQHCTKEEESILGSDEL